MSGFVIFALVLTFAYVVYFAVQITLDLHGNKGEKSTEEEIYDVGDMANEEQPVAVEEHNDDPDLSVPTYTEHVTEDGLRVLNPTGKSVVLNPPVVEEPSQETQTELPVSSQELNEDNEAHLEHIDPKMQCSFFADEFMQNLNEKHNKRKIEKKNARDKM